MRAPESRSIFYGLSTMSQQADDLDLIQMLAGVVVVYLVARVLARCSCFSPPLKNDWQMPMAAVR